MTNDGLGRGLAEMRFGQRAAFSIQVAAKSGVDSRVNGDLPSDAIKLDIPIFHIELPVEESGSSPPCRLESPVWCQICWYLYPVLAHCKAPAGCSGDLPATAIRGQ